MKLPIGTPILDMSSPDFVQQFNICCGIESCDIVEIITPQFTRTDGIAVPAPLSDPHFWKTLHTWGDSYLQDIGMQKWEESEKGCLWLFPFEWYGSIPDGFSITDINGDQDKFKKGITDDDYRFGALSFGIFKQKEAISDQAIKKWTREELIELKLIYREKLKALKNN